MMINRSQTNDARFWKKWDMSGAVGAIPAKGMMFYDNDIRTAFDLAKAFGDGRVATLLDIVDARIAEDEHAPVWTQYVVTNSAEYFGQSKGGNDIIITAHGVGPLTNSSRLERAFSGNGWVPDLAPIDESEFRALESGRYGDVTILDESAYRGGMNNFVSLRNALRSPVIKARFGPRTEVFLNKCARISAAEGGDAYILMDDARYERLRNWLDRDVGEGFFGGSLLTLRQLVMYHHGRQQSLASEIGAGAVDGVGRFVGMRGKGRLEQVHGGIDVILDNIEEHWQDLMVPADVPQSDIYMLSGADEDIALEGGHGPALFASPKKYGGVIPDDAPVLAVKRLEQVPGPAHFRTTVPGYHGWVKYETSEVKAIMPEGANAYRTGEWSIISDEKGNPEWHEAPITFYRVDVDNTRRLLSRDEVRKDLGLTLRLLSR